MTLVLLGVCLRVQGYQLSPVIVSPINGHRYVLLHSQRWTASEAEAVALGGHLATIRSAAEENWVFNTFGGYGGQNRLLWIGLNDTQVEGTFQWVSGESVTYTNWAPNEPNSTGSEDYVAIYYPGHSAQNRWNDWSDRSSDPIGLPFNGVVEIIPGPDVFLSLPRSNWKYLDNGSDQGSAWRLPGFNDSGWTNGNAQLGYGDGDETTVVQSGPTGNHYITTYFRRSFVVTNAATFTNLTAHLLRDDGAVVYLNGVEIFRSNMPTNAITYLTPAVAAIGDSDENFISVTNVNPSLLVTGTNVLAAEVHQSQASSSDISFDFWLTGRGNFKPKVSLNLPPLGNVAAAGDIPFSALATDEDGLVNRVEYFVNGIKVGEAGTFPFWLTWSNAPAGSYVLTAVATDSSGLSVTSAPVQLAVLEGLIRSGANWKFFDQGQDLGTAWRTPDYNDSTWLSGPAQLGYGEGDEATVVNGGPSNSRFITTYFRHSFQVPDPGSLTNLTAYLLRDDGAVVYLNDKEVFRSNLPAGGGITYATLASTTVQGVDETTFFPYPVSPGRLVQGTNVLAVEIHQADASSSDVSFDFALLGHGKTPSPRLGFVIQGNMIDLYWSAFPSRFVLEMADSLNGAPNWTTPPGNTTLSNGVYHHQLSPAAGPQRFFRLRSAL